MFPITGTIQLFLSLILFYLTLLFYRTYRLEGGIIAKFFFFVFALFALIFLALALPAIFMTKNQSVWLVAMVLVSFFQVLVGAILGYIITYLKSSKISPRTGFFSLLIIETILVIPSVIHPPLHFLKPNGVVGMTVEPWVAILRYLGILIFLIPGGIVFLQQAIKTQESRIKIRSFGLGLGFLSITLVYLIDFILTTFFKVDPLWSDIILGITFLIMLLIVLFAPTVMKRSRWARLIK